MGIFSDLFGKGRDKEKQQGQEGTAPEAKAEPAPEPPKPEPARAEPPKPERKPEPPKPERKPEPRPKRRQQEEDEDMEGVQRLVSRKVERVLEQLGALAARARTGEEVPTITVTLHLAHGHSVTGEVVDYVARESVLLALGGLLRSDSVTYVDLSTVVAVTVGNAQKLLEVAQLVRPNPTRQDLVTLVERLPHAITEQFWPGEASLGGRPLRFEVDWVGLDDEVGRRALEAAVNVAGHALRALAQEQGREVLRRIATVRFVMGQDTRASLQGETGTVTVAPGSGEPTVSAFRKAFASGLR
jgi:hypothetical protein